MSDILKSQPVLPKAEQSIVMVAIYELVKGVAAVTAAALVFGWHEHLPRLAEALTNQLHYLVGNWLGAQLQAINHFANRANQNWLKIFWLVMGYALLRFAEAYGLYRDKTWAYWYSVLGYGIFIPLELYYLIVKPFDWLHLLAFLLNVVIVIVVYLKMRKKGLLPSFNKAQ